MPIVADTTCNPTTGGVGAASHVCAGTPQGAHDACQGDSGGPLFQQLGDGKFVQIGVTSWGIGCAEQGHYGVYGKVPAAVVIRTMS